MRIAIAGCPRAGKTTLGKRLAAELGCTAQHADDLIETHDWSAASAELARRMLAAGPWLVEGVAVIRALRKALELTDGKPCDRLLWMESPRVPLTAGQRRMFEADARRLADIEGELRKRGVEIVRERASAPVSKRAAEPPRPIKPVPAPAPMQAEPGPMLVDVDVDDTRWGDYGGRGFG